MSDIRITGGCNCGAVRYVLTAEPTLVVVCHCRNCRHQSGSAFSINIVVPEDAMQLLAGELAEFTTDNTESGRHVRWQNCPRCGSPVRNYRETPPGIVVVKGGTLDEPAAWPPTLHIFTAERLPWVAIPPGLQQYPGNPEFAA